jgi:preprotein translocase subunit SecF
MTINIIGNKHLFLGISAIAVTAALCAIMVFGFNQGIDFAGGTLWRLQAPGDTVVTQTEMQEVFASELELPEAVVTFDERSNSFLAKLPVMNEDEHAQNIAILRGRYPGIEELSYQSIGPSVGAELRQKSYLAIVLVLVGISLYIAFAFRKIFRPISSWKYGIVTLVTLFHDVILSAGFIAYLGASRGVEIDGNFVVALLVIMGFSVHDTIVVFDRIRENLLLERGKLDFAETINVSINQTLARSINTSLTLIVVLVALFLTGPQNLSYFILTLLIGVSVGIYSSIFVASPLLLVWQTAGRKHAEK